MTLSETSVGLSPEILITWLASMLASSFWRVRYQGYLISDELYSRFGKNSVMVRICCRMFSIAVLSFKSASFQLPSTALSGSVCILVALNPLQLRRFGCPVWGTVAATCREKWQIFSYRFEAHPSGRLIYLPGDKAQVSGYVFGTLVPNSLCYCQGALLLVRIQDAAWLHECQVQDNIGGKSIRIWCMWYIYLHHKGNSFHSSHWP